MPHMIIDYSAGMDKIMDMQAMCDHMREAISAIDIFPTAGVRVRAFAATHYSMADGADHHHYIDLSLRLRGGRPLDIRQAATETLFAAAQAFLEPVMAKHSVALSFEMRNLDPELAPKVSTTRDHMKDA